MHTRSSACSRPPFMLLPSHAPPPVIPTVHRTPSPRPPPSVPSRTSDPSPLLPALPRLSLGCPAPLPTIGYGREELESLGNLEVVVTHGNPGPWLKVLEVAHSGSSEDRAVATVARRVRPVHLQLVQPLEVPGERAAGAVDLEAHPDVRPDADPAVFKRPSGAVIEPHEATHVVPVLHRSHLSALDREVPCAHAHRHLRPLPDKSFPLRRDACDGTEQVLGHGHRVGHDVPEHPETRTLLLVAPGQ